MANKIAYVPAELNGLLTDFILEVFNQNPEDVVDFAAVYFNALSEKKKNTKDSKRHEASEKQEADGMESSVVSGCLNSTCYEYRAPVFNKKSQARSRRLLQRRNSIAGDPFESLDSDLDYQEIFYPKSEQATNRVQKILKEIFIFKSCSRNQLEKVTKAMYERRVFAGELIVRQGDHGENFYVIDKGTFDVIFEVGDCKKNIGQIGGPGSFGELALMYNCPRSASVVATGDGIVWVLDRFTFRRILFTTTERKRSHYEHLLENMPILSLLNAYERAVLADALETQVFEDNACIIREGDAADCMYFIEEGRVAICIQDEQEQDSKNIISHAEKGDYFGELALVYKTKRIASVFADGRVTCACLDINAFERLLGPCKDLMKRNAEKYENQRKMLGVKELQQ